MLPTQARSRAAACLTAAALLSGVSAPAAAQPAEDERYYYWEIHEPFFTPDPEREGWMRNARPSSNPASFPRRKAPGSLRVLIFGGSTAGSFNGWGDLSSALQELWTGGGSEVLNTGMSGYDSHRERLVLDSVLDLESDAAVFLTGHNDFFINNFPPVPLWRLKAAARLGNFAGFQTLRRRLAPDPREAAGVRGRETRLREMLANVAGHIRRVRRRGTLPVVCLPPLNYEGMPPNVEVDWASPGFLKGYLAFIRGRNEEASRLWENAAVGESDPRRLSLIWHYAGRAAARRRRWKAAGRAYGKSLEFSSGDGVCAPPCLEALRETARREGAVVADVDAAFRRRAAPRLPGIGMFIDEIHWARELHPVVSREIVLALAGSPELSGGSWNRVRLAQLEAGGGPPVHSYDEDNPRGGTLYFAVEGTNRSWLRINWRTVAWFSALSELEPAWFSSWGRLEAAVERVYAQRRERRPGLYASLPQPPRLDRLAGYFAIHELERGRWASALRSFDRVDPEQARLPELWLLRAVAERFSGRPDAARRSLERARAAELGPAADILPGVLATAGPP